MKTQRIRGKWGADKTALVVDDNPLMRRLIVDAFLANGFKTCAEARNGKEAVEVAEKIHPHVITMDLSMPVMNGLEAASKLRKILPNTPIILLSLYADTLSKEEAARAGISLVLPKGTDLSTLVDTARQLMGC